MAKTVKITEEAVANHDRSFREAVALVKGEFLIQEQSEMRAPGWLLRRKLNRALALFESVIHINPENWSAMWFIGKVHQRFRDWAEALSWFERSYQINPSHPGVAREASNCAMEIGRCDTAIVFAHRAVQIKPTDAGLQANLALAYLLAGRLSDAKTAVDRALSGNPSDTISKTIQAMVQHFITDNRVPPADTPALLEYWRKLRK